MSEVRPEDLRRDSWRAVDGQRQIRYTHLPTGTSAEGETSEGETIHALDTRVYKELEQKLAALDSA